MGPSEHPPGDDSTLLPDTGACERCPDVLREERAHDVLAQTFAAILVQLHAADANAVHAPTDAIRHRELAVRLARDGLVQARRAMEALRLRDATACPGVTLHAALARLTRWADACCSARCDFFDGRGTLAECASRDAVAYECAHAIVAAVATSVECTHVRLRLGSRCGRLVLSVDVCWAEHEPAWLATLPSALASRLAGAGAALRVRRAPTGCTLQMTAEFPE